MLSSTFVPWIALIGVLVALRVYVRRWRSMRLVTIIDGDTFIALDGAGNKRKLRLADIDCPELSQRNGTQAREFVQQRAAAGSAQVQLLGRDRYQRYCARIRIDGVDLSLALVQAGLAYPLRGWRLRAAALRARLSFKGVHAGLGQPKPWQAGSRSSILGRWLARRRHRAARGSQRARTKAGRRR